MKMNKKELVISVLFSLALILVLLVSSFEIGAYGDWDFYQKEYEKYEVAEYLTMEMPDIMEVTKYMMSYLRGGEEELSIVKEIEGVHQDFFNEQDRFHMGEVKDLFLGGFMIRRVSLIILAGTILALYKMKSEWKAFLPNIFRRTLLVLAVLIGALAYFISQNFSRVFTIFHEIFFDNDLWLFDPRTDFMIRMLPEGFFYDIVIRIGSIFIVLLAIALISSTLISKTYKKNKIY